MKLNQKIEYLFKESVMQEDYNADERKQAIKENNAERHKAL